MAVKKSLEILSSFIKKKIDTIKNTIEMSLLGIERH